MTEKLGELFDFQKFENSASLQAVIDAAHMRYKGRALSDDEVEMVSAAGTPEAALKRSRPLEDEK